MDVNSQKVNDIIKSYPTKFRRFESKRQFNKPGAKAGRVLVSILNINLKSSPLLVGNRKDKIGARALTSYSCLTPNFSTTGVEIDNPAS
jgi:hypothetical protein